MKLVSSAVLATVKPDLFTQLTTKDGFVLCLKATPVAFIYGTNKRRKENLKTILPTYKCR